MVCPVPLEQFDGPTLEILRAKLRIQAWHGSSHARGWSNTSTDSWIAIVYLYGHGGSGVTLSWGCTAEVANLVAMASRLAGTTFPSGPLTP